MLARRSRMGRRRRRLGAGNAVDSDRDRAESARRAGLRHLFAAAEGAHRDARLADRRRRREPGHRAAAVPRGRRPREARPPLHQLTRGVRHRRARHLRYDAIRASRDRDAVHRTGSFDGGLAARGRRTWEADGATQLPGHDPPADGRISGAGNGRRYPGARDPEDPAPDERAAGGARRKARRADRQGHRARLLSERDRGLGVRGDRSGDVGTPIQRIRDLTDDRPTRSIAGGQRG